MDELLITATRDVNLYHGDQRRIPGYVHLVRSIGGPIFNLFVVGICALLATVVAPGFWLALVTSLVSTNLFFGLGGLLGIAPAFPIYPPPNGCSCSRCRSAHSSRGALGGSTTPGTGLGLAISYGIVEGHGGTISVASTIGRRATITVRLPIIAELPQPAVADGSTARLSTLRILVVDDEQVVAESLGRLLAGYGHQVVLAANGEIDPRRYREQAVRRG